MNEQQSTEQLESRIAELSAQVATLMARDEEREQDLNDWADRYTVAA